MATRSSSSRTSPRSTAWATSRCARSTASRSRSRSGEFVAIMGAVGLGQVDADEHPRLPRSARPRGTLPARRRGGLGAEPRRARRDPQPQLGFVFQSFNLLSRTSALENVELPLLYARRARARARTRARARRSSASASATALDHHPNQLSGGQQQRVAIARALVNEPARHPRRRAHRQPRLAHQRRDHGALPGARAQRASPSCWSRTSPTSPSYAVARRSSMQDGRVRSDERQRAAGARPSPPQPPRRRAMNLLADPPRRGPRARCATRCARSSPRSASSSASARSSRWSPSARAPRSQVEAAFAVDGHEPPHRPARARRRRAARAAASASHADADLGRPARRSSARCRAVQLRGARRCAPARRWSARTQNWTTQRHRHRRPTTSRSATGRSRAGARFTAADVDARHQGRRARADRGRQAVRRRTPTRSARLVRIKNIPFQVVGVLEQQGAVADGPGLRRRRFIPVTTFQREDPGRPQQVHRRASSIVERDSADDHGARAEADHRAAARPPPHRRRRATTTSPSAT